MGIPVKLPLMARTEDIVTMFIAEKESSGVGTRKNDNSFHFIREQSEDGFIKLCTCKNGR
jgi:hypothetical protein